ncbi:MAG TPA: serine hydrolase domain-containing protein [Gemmatimonadaceae bacterium]|nr:serine hydrolase domain-containing protein [Gemmatimonadaceae bacterium]
MVTVRFVVLSMTVLAACAPQSPSSSADSTSAASSAVPDSVRIGRVMAGLRPLVEVVGRPPVQWQLAERMAYYNVPGISIAVVHNGKLAWARGVGVKQAGTSDSVTPTTLFQAASISKPVTATGMLRLMERGTLDLDADVNTYLKSWKVPDNRFTATEKVTLRRIVSHTAGLTVHGFPGYEPSAAMPTVVQVLDGAKPANTEAVRVDTTPGAISRYSGGGTTIMQQLLIDVTGKQFAPLIQELVLGPAGMSHSTFEQPLPAARTADASRAHDRKGTMVPGGWHVYPERAAAGLWTTPSDLTSWALAITAARAGRSTDLLSQETVTKMLTPVKEGIGLGPFVGGEGRNFHFGHGGANEGFHSDLVMYPELGVGAAVMTNGDGGPMLIREVMRALAAEYEWPDYAAKKVTTVALTPAAVAGLTGKYMLKVGPGIVADIHKDGERIMMTAPQIPVEELLPESDTTFVTSTLGWRITFARDASGRATGLTVVRENGPPVQGSRVP